MRLLCVDIGSGTQDVLYMDTAQPAENAVQLVLPSPTVLVARKIEAATVRREPLALVGSTMGGGVCTTALRSHLEARLDAYATPDAARTFDDDLDQVASWGVQLVGPSEIERLRRATVVEMGDINLTVLERGLGNWDVRLAPDVIGVAVLDHGAAPPGESDRLFRFRHLEEWLRKGSSIESFVFTSTEIPEYLTRMRAVARSVGSGIPLVLMDTGAAAVMGSSLDRLVAVHSRRIALNAGNSHTLAFHLSGPAVLGMFEHHTSLLSLSRLEALIEGLVRGRLSSTDIYEEGGHGAVMLAGRKGVPFITVTGPRRALLMGSRFNPYFAAPFGNMMLAGCFGLAQAIALKLPEWGDELGKALAV